MLAHRLSLVTFALLATTAHGTGTARAPEPHACLAAADSILDFSGGDGSASQWSGAAGRRSVRRLADAVATTTGAYTSECLLSAAEATAKKAVAEDPNSVNRRYALAVVLGMRADREGGRAKIRAASALYDDLRAILAMDPGHVGAHHLLGRLEAGVMRMDRVTRWLAIHLLGGGSLKGASWAEAERNLAFAVAAAPTVPDYRYELAHLYEDTGRASLALEEARKVLTMDPSAALEPGEHAKAAALIRRVEAREASGAGGSAGTLRPGPA